MERRYLRGNGELLHARYSVSALRDGSGRFLYALAIIQDVTAQVLGEEALRASEERFRLALDATDDGIWDWDIQRDTMHVSERWLARLGYGPHEVACVGSCVALVHEEDRPAFQEHIQALDDAREGVGQIARIAQDLKTFSRSDDRWSSLDLRRVVESSIRFAERAVSERARLVREFCEVPPVTGAEGRLSQVFLNLLLNAAQAIPPGHAEEHQVTVRIRSGADQQVRVEIRDTGCGISAEQLGKIFNPFFTTKPAGVGTGLGLSICHEFVAAHGGRIEVQSEVGRGSTFSVVLPAASGS
jgi:PAS domain S-box-containing protein